MLALPTRPRSAHAASSLLARSLALLAVIGQLSGGWLHAWQVESAATHHGCAFSAGGEAAPQVCDLTPHDAHQSQHHDEAACATCQLLHQTRHATTGSATLFLPPAPLTAALAHNGVFGTADRLTSSGAPRAPPTLS